MRSPLLPLAAAALLLLSACETQPFPRSWDPPETALLPDGCAALQGVYVDGASPQSFGLIELLSGRPAKRLHADRVQLTMPAAGALKAEAYLGTTNVATLHFSESEQTLACRDDSAELAVGGMWAREGMFGVSKVTLALHKDRQGNLLVRQEERGVGVYGILPIPGGATNWYRFRPAPPSTP
jgi:hypothetical protein